MPMSASAEGGSGGGRDPVTVPDAGDHVTMPGAVLVADVAAKIAREQVREALFGDPRRAATLGRFQVLERVGKGGMGEVYAAFDPELGRRVAVKIVTGDPGDTVGRARMMAEARAMATISHPNVVPVFDVGTTEDGQLFIAMEFVQGTTLRQWVTAKERSWQDIVDHYMAAGRGLAAAHAQGLVHRDFKPDNVMVGDDDRVRVLDFGLVRAGPDARVKTPLDSSIDPSVETDDGAITRDGAIVGTLAYLAPEQLLLGGKGDARSDQFGFCVALYEALAGERPFPGRTAAAIAGAMHEGPPALKTRKVPEWVKAVVRRGLSLDPAARFPDMNALLHALASDPARRRRRFIGAGVVVLAAVGALGGKAVLDARAVSACHALGDAALDVWNDEVREATRTSILGSGASAGAEIWARVDPAVTDHAEAWRLSRREACLATEVRGEPASDLHARKIACLEERGDALRALVATISSADAATSRNAMQMIIDLEPVAQCEDEAWLLHRPVPPSGPLRAEIAAVARRLAEANALRSSGRYREALGEGEAALARAIELDHPATLAEAHLFVGDTLAALAEREASIENLEAAYFVGGRAGHEMIASNAAVSLVNAHNDRPADFPTAELWAKNAEMVLARAGLTGGAPHARLLAHLGELAGERAQHEEELDLAQQSLDMRVAAYGPDHAMVGRSHVGVAGAHRAMGHFDEARDHFETALAIYLESLGPIHPDVAAVFGNLGLIHKDQGRFDEAIESLERAMAMHEEIFGPTHQLVGNGHQGLAATYMGKGDYDRAARHYEEAARVWRASLGDDHPELGMAWLGLANARLSQSRTEEATAAYARAREVFETAFGPDHPHVATVLNNVGNVAMNAGRYDEAEADFERARAIWEKAYGAEHPTVAAAIANLGNVAGLRGDYDEAVTLLQRSLAIKESTLGREHPGLATTLESLGDVELKRDRHDDAEAHYRRALALAETAMGENNAELAPLLTKLAEGARTRGKEQEAKAWLDRAAAVAAEGEPASAD
jgi:tetratricopeptide (TPR) repeat protein